MTSLGVDSPTLEEPPTIKKELALKTQLTFQVGPLTVEKPHHNMGDSRSICDSNLYLLGVIADFDTDSVQGCQLMMSEEFGHTEQLSYKQMLAHPLLEDEGVTERSLSHRNSMKQVRTICVTM